MDPDKALTPQEVADTLRIAKNTVYELIKRGELQAFKVGNKFRVNAAVVEAYRFGARPESEARTEARNEARLFFGSSFPGQDATDHTLPLEAAGLSPGSELSPSGSFVLCGQDQALDILAREMEQRLPGSRVYRSYLGSYNGLHALYQGTVQVASAHLWDQQRRQYNLPFLPALLPGIPLTLVHLACRNVGYYVPKGNPAGLTSWSDLGREDLVLANREPGSGIRVLLDQMLRAQGRGAAAVPGYRRSYPTHLMAAAAVVRGVCHYGVGCEKAISGSRDLDFIPLQEERYELVFPTDQESQPLVQALVAAVQSQDFKAVLSTMGGYRLDDTGTILRL